MMEIDERRIFFRWEKEKMEKGSLGIGILAATRNLFPFLPFSLSIPTISIHLPISFSYTRALIDR